MPAGLELSRLVVVGVGKIADLKAEGFRQARRCRDGEDSALPPRKPTIVADLPGGAFKPERAADLALGVRLRAYSFDRYKTKRKDDEDRAKEIRVAIAVAGVAAAQKAWTSSREAVANGVVLARDLVNEPANVLFPEEFARRVGNAEEARRGSRGARRRRHA